MDDIASDSMNKNMSILIFGGGLIIGEIYVVGFFFIS